MSESEREGARRQASGKGIVVTTPLVTVDNPWCVCVCVCVARPVGERQYQAGRRPGQGKSRMASAGEILRTGWGGDDSEGWPGRMTRMGYRKG